MADGLRWLRVPSRWARFPLPDPNEQILFVAAVDVLSYLENDPDLGALADVLRNLLAASEPVPDTIPDWMKGEE